MSHYVSVLVPMATGGWRALLPDLPGYQADERSLDLAILRTSGFLAQVTQLGSAIPKKVRRTRFDITLSDDTLAAIDDYRFATHAPNRAEAVRRLLRVGLSAEPPDSVSTPQDR